MVDYRGARAHHSGDLHADVAEPAEPDDRHPLAGPRVGECIGSPHISGASPASGIVAGIRTANASLFGVSTSARSASGGLSQSTNAAAAVEAQSTSAALPPLIKIAPR